jgi:hypothetical protein
MPAQNKPSTRSQYSAGEISSASASNISLSKTEDTTRRFNLLKDQVPELGGKILWNLASSDQPDAMLVATAVRSMDLGQIKSGVEMLKGESIEQQKVKWENMSTAKQQIYLDNGYSVPKESSPWWKSALGTAFSPVKAGLRGIGAVGSAIGETPIGTGLGYIGQGAGWLLNVPNEIYDNAIARPYRMQVDTAGQNQEARLDLAFEEARQNLEKEGVDLTDGEWKYLKWKYVEVNGLKRTQYGYAGANPEESIGARTAFGSLPGGRDTLRFLDAATQINPIADFVRGIPLAGRLVADPKSENPYDKTERASGSGVSDSVYEMFNNEVKRVSEDEDYNLSPWSSWNRASNGSTMISPIKQVESIDKLRSAGLDGEAFDYALFRAKGRSQDEWLQEVEGVTPDDPQFAEKRLALGQKYEGQETVKEVIGDLSANASKYSIGRGYARALGLDENSALFTAVSGSADAALVMTLDPTLFLGKANKLWRTVKKGVQLTDLARIRWFAGGLREGGNILNMPIIEGVENIASVSRATSKIDSSDRILKSVFGRSTLDNLEPLIDESGRVTDFAIDNYDEIHELLDDAKSVLLNQRIGYNKVIAEEAVDEGYNFAEAVYKGDLALLNEQLNGVEIAKQLMSRVPPNGDSIKTLGRTLSHARTKQAEKYNLWIETVNDVFKKLRVADQDERYIIVNELRRRLPKGNAVVTELLEYDAKLIQSGFAGLDDYDSVWDFIEANAMIWGSGRGTGQAVKGFGNGMKVRDSWRLFSDGSDLRLFDRNAYTSLPELTKAGVLLRKAVAKSERVIEETQRLKNFNLAFDRNVTKVENFAIRFVSKPARMTAALAWNLTHHVPKSNGVMSLTGPDAVAEFEKFLNQGVFAGMKQKDRDIFMGKFLLGFGEDTVDRWIFNGTVAEGQASYNAWRELLNSKEGKKLVDKLREFSGTKINPNVPATSATPLQAIFHESGQLTEYGIKNFDELKAIVWDVFYRDLENMEPFTNPPVSLPEGIQIFNKQIEANSRSATLASRFLVERLFLEDLFQRTGMYDVPGGKEVVDRFLHQLTNTRYAPNDLDKVGLDEAAQRVALLPTAQYSDMISTPDFLQDIQANATKLGLLARTIRTTFNGDIIETVMSTYWKPITLLRLGFIPRAAGEEFLAFYARAGIWAPLALAATQSAADRRGLLTGIVNLPSKLTAKKFGQLSRAGLDDDLWKLSAMAPYRNVSDYIYSVARAAHKKPTDLNRYDYLGLYSAYWTGSVARSAKQLQFKLLPEILQTGIMSSMTQKNQNWIKEGLVTLDGLSDAVRLSADAAIRDPYFQRGIAAAHEESGRTAMFNPADEDLGTNDISVRKGIYGTETEKVTVQLLHEYEPIPNYDEATAVEISYTYSQADQEIVLKPVIEHFAGAVDESTLDGAIAPMFRDTEYAVPFSVIEPEEVFQPFVADDFGFDIDLIDPNDLSRGAIGNEAPDLLDRYVETLKVRADGLPKEATTTLDEAGNEVILSNRFPEFTVDSELTINDLDLLDQAAMDPDQFVVEYTEIIEQISDKDLLELQAKEILANEIREQTGEELVDNVTVDLINTAWDKRQAAKKFQPEQVRQYLDELRAEGKLEQEPYDLVKVLVPSQDVAKKAYNIPSQNISRANLVADLRRLAGDELGPRSTPDRSIWFNSEVLDSSDEAESLRALAEVIFQRGYVEPPIAEAIGSASRMATEDIVASANRFRESVLNLPSKDLRLLYEWIQGSGSVPNRSNVMPDWEALGLLGADSVLTPAMKEMLKASQTNSSFHVLVQRALTDKMQMDDSRLFDIIDILSKTDSPRYRQVLIGDTPIRSIKREQLITEAKPILLAALNDPNVSKQVRGNRRYLVNSKTAKNLAIPTGDNVQPIYYVMAGGALNEDLIRMFSTFTDKEYYEMLEAVSEAGYGPEILDSIDQIINNLNSDSLKALLEAAEVRGGDMLPVGSVGFIDYDHAREVSDALEIVLNTIDTYPAGESLRTIRVGASAAPKNANVILPLPPTGRQNYGYAYQSRDDGLLWGARPLDPNDIRRFDDGGNLDDFGNHVIEGGTINENLDAWADTLNQFVNDIFFSQRGEVLHEVIEPMRRGTFAVDAAAQIPSTDLPAGLYRPKKFIVEPETNWVTKAARFGFGKIINPAIFALVRHPMYLLAFSNGYEFARVNNIVFRSKRLDQFAEIWAKNNKADLNELRNIWAMIPEDRRAGIYSIDQLKDQMMELAFDGKLNMDSPYVQLIDDLGVASMSKEQRSDISSLIDWVKMDQNVERINTRVAMDRAMEEMIPYIDDHQVRSFFQEYARNIMPFEFAQEQFLKRWARTLSYSPEGFRRIQLLAHAFTTNGFIQEQNGEKYLVIPGTESLNSLIATLPVLDGLFGGNIRLPTAVPMGLNTRNILPGIPNDLENLPAFSPVAMFGVEQLSNHFPEIKTIAQQFNGGRPIESDDNIIDAFVDFIPQNYQRLYAGLARNNLPLPKGIEGEYTRNVMTAVQQAAAEAERLKAEQRQLVLLGKEQEAANMQRRINQLQPPIGSTKQQEEEWLDTIKDWTRANMFVRGALGFVMPTTSQNLFEGKELSGEFGVLLGQMDFDTALATFLAEHPDGAAYTIFATKKTSKAPIPTTEKAINWMRNNQGWMKAYPKAAPWLIPQQKSTDVHSPQAYSDAIGMGIRNMKDINEWYADFKFAAGANRYFPTKEAFDLAKSQAKTSAERSLLEAQWQAESEIIKKQHPIFSEKLQSMVSTDADLTMQELRNILALPDSELPDVEQIDGLREAVGSWDVYVSEYSLLAGKNSKAARAKREDLKIRFIAYGKDLVLRYPEMRTFWNSIVLSSLDLVSKKKILESGEL